VRECRLKITVVRRLTYIVRNWNSHILHNMHRQCRKDTGRSGIALSRVLPLLVLSIFINYIDRGNLSIAAPQLREEFGLSSSQLGVLLSAFFWTYAVFQIVSGWLEHSCTSFQRRPASSLMTRRFD
jgi:sugar phosphate permease